MHPYAPSHSVSQSLWQPHIRTNKHKDHSCSVSLCWPVNKQKDTHTQTHPHPIPLESTYRAWEKNCTVILHNKSPKHVLPLHSLRASQLFRTSISSSVHRKHVSICSGSFVVKKAKLFFFYSLFFHLLFIRTAAPSNSSTDSMETCLAGDFFSIEFKRLSS